MGRRGGEAARRQGRRRHEGGGLMAAKKWNLVIDVSRCMDCNDCFLADKDEFTGNDFPPYSVAQPWSGHRWMNIMRTERGQYPLVQVAYRPTPCLHCDDAPCIKDSPAGHRLQARGRPGDHRPGEGQGPSGDRRHLPVRGHLLERRGPGGPEVHRLRPSAGRRLDGHPLLAGLPGRRHQAGAGRRRRDGGPGGGRGPGGAAARTGRQAARLLQEPAPVRQGLHRRPAWSSATPTSAPRAPR